MGKQVGDHRRAWDAIAPGMLALVILVVDQVTKVMVRTWLHGTVVVIPGFFHLHRVENRGAAFGLMRSLPDQWRLPLFSVATLVAVLGLLYLFRSLPPRKWWVRLSVGAILGGALGNFIDRVFIGTVTDFLEVFYRTWTWPNFNVADMGISVGITLVAIDLVFSRDEFVGATQPRADTADEASGPGGDSP